MVQAAQERANPPSPIPISGGFRDLEEVNREIFCCHYSCCLDQADSLDWPGFSCQECRAFLPAPGGPEEWQEDAISCRRLIEYVLRDLSPEIVGVLQENEHKDLSLWPALEKAPYQTRRKAMDGAEDKLLRVNAAARRLGRSDEQVRRLYNQGKIKGIRPSERGIRLYESSVEAYLMARQE
ncbi:MAG: helix-turn-helix transcriptional regulator [Desulfobaccales bacterium]